MMLCGTKRSDDGTVYGSTSRLSGYGRRLISFFDKLPSIISRKKFRGSLFSTAFVPDQIVKYSEELLPDIYHVHWINSGFMKIETFSRLKKPIVWTFHDMWPFTGGCHYSGECIRYTDSCGCCPELVSKREKDLSQRVWMRKNKIWNNLPLTIVTPSRWLGKCASDSSLFSNADIRVIPNGIDINTYRPQNTATARKLLGLPQDRHLILFGALSATEDQRKGYDLLIPAVRAFSETDIGKKSELLVYGSNEPGFSSDFGMKSRYVGHIRKDEDMVMLNSAADVFIAPSKQDNLPNTVMEALACGIPVIAFNIGGMPDMINHLENGWLATPFDHKDLARGIVHVLENDDRRNEMGRKARQKAEREYSGSVISLRHIRLYEEILFSRK